MKQVIRKDQYIQIGDNQIYQDGNLFVVEKFEYIQGGIKMYSVYDGYSDLEQAIKIAKTLY